jgi:hypothetical protein
MSTPPQPGFTAEFMRGKTAEELVAALGRPYSYSQIQDGQILVQWMGRNAEFHIAVLFAHDGRFQTITHVSGRIPKFPGTSPQEIGLANDFLTGKTIDEVVKVLGPPTSRKPHDVEGMTLLRWMTSSYYLAVIFDFNDKFQTVMRLTGPVPQFHMREHQVPPIQPLLPSAGTEGKPVRTHDPSPQVVPDAKADLANRGVSGLISAAKHEKSSAASASADSSEENSLSVGM